jgi:hypothetical protein
MNPRVGVVGVVAAVPFRGGEAASLQEFRELAVRDLVALDPEVAHVHAMHRRLVRSAVVAAHPEGAGLHQHDAVGAGRRAAPEGQPDSQGDGRRCAPHRGFVTRPAGEYRPGGSRLIP